ncbi:MAG: prolyl oligopeptidase family serine peptidase [Deltaproteobacteria bacterium]|nr:prolyl oligopeptidase family serine peptidase [Deltaproteobacteria bacterium]
MLQRLLSATAAQLDRAVSHAAVGLLSRHKVATLDHPARVTALRGLVQRYADPAFRAEPDRFFPRVSATVDAVHAGTRGALEVTDLSWDSRFHPFSDDVAATYDRDPRNRRAYARLYSVGEGGRPAVVLVHGFLCGQWSVEEKLWPLAAFSRWGLDAALLVLPFHALRSAPMSRPRFPGADPRLNIEGFRQSIQDLRVLVEFLRARGATAVGLMGMSLGGYVSALAATLDPFDFVVPMIPLGSIADFARDGGRLGGTPDERYLQHRLLDDCYGVVSPFSRPPRVRPEAALVITGDGDRVTPANHARRLADHFQARLHVFHGGHLLQFGRAHGFRAVGTMLDRLGLRHRAAG